jgi:hypothetical protein
MEHSPLDLARLTAIKAYSDLEYELMLLFKVTLGVSAELASAIFYQIIAARTRHAIFSSAMDINHRDTFAKAWPKIGDWLLPCDTARNHIIHWSEGEKTIVRVSENKIKVVSKNNHLENSVRMFRPSANPLTYNETAILEKAKAFTIMKHIVNRLNLTMHRPSDWPWTDIFQQPVSDRTPVQFLSRLNDRGFPAQL